MSFAITSQGWFSLGERVPYDRRTKRILHPDHSTNSPDIIRVFQRVVSDGSPSEESAWTTFLPGFPDGSFGWARVDLYLASSGSTPRILVEFVGQGDSDKPTDYPYGTSWVPALRDFGRVGRGMERADLVEAHWQAQGIQSTFLVTFDFSSLVALELLSRQQERLDSGSKPFTRVEKVLMVNGGLSVRGKSAP